MCASSHDNLNGRTSATEVSQSIAGAGAAAAAAQACLQRRQGHASRHAIATDEFLLPDSELSESSPRRKPPGFLHYKKLAMTMQLCGWAVHAQCVVSSFGACSVQRAAQARVAPSPEASMLGDQAEGEDTSEQLPCPCEACKAAFATMKAGRVAVAVPGCVAGRKGKGTLAYSALALGHPQARPTRDTTKADEVQAAEAVGPGLPRITSSSRPGSKVGFLPERVTSALMRRKSRATNRVKERAGIRLPGVGLGLRRAETPELSMEQLLEMPVQCEPTRKHGSEYFKRLLRRQGR